MMKIYTISPFVVNEFTESSGEKYLRKKSRKVEKE